MNSDSSQRNGARVHKSPTQLHKNTHLIKRDSTKMYVLTRRSAMEIGDFIN